MNISSNYSNRPAFGMAFTRPNQEVMDYFKSTIDHMSPKERETFVNTVRGLVDGFKDCPVPVGHQIARGGGTARYVAIIDGMTYCSAPDPKYPANEIVSTMQRAIEKGRDMANANENFDKLKRVFDIKA